MCVFFEKKLVTPWGIEATNENKHSVTITVFSYTHDDTYQTEKMTHTNAAENIDNLLGSHSQRPIETRNLQVS